MPKGTRAKTVKDGGCLTFAAETTDSGAPANDETGLLYALKGNNTCEFYSYSLRDNAWTTRESIPAYNRLRKKKFVKKGACLVASGGEVYVTKGNGTLDFGATRRGRRVTHGLSCRTYRTARRRLKEGVTATAVAIGDMTYIYLMKGSGTTEFYRYNTISRHGRR